MITVVTGKEIEKIKGEFESVINGMNMVGEIPYTIYSKLFDIGAEWIQKAYELGRSELEKANVDRLTWHDLRKNPKDLPKNGVEVLNEDGDKVRYEAVGYSGWIAYSEYEERDVEVDAPVAWCEVPTFNTWLNEDEVKEE